MPKRRTKIIRDETPNGGAFAPVRVVVFQALEGPLAGREFRLVVRHGRRVRIPFKPRGDNMGWRWQADAYLVGGRQVWGSDNVDKAIGCDRVLGIIEANLKALNEALR